MMVIGTLALTGFPLTAGYFSKDMIIEVSHAADTEIAHVAFVLLVIAAFLTSFYSWRLIFMAFYGTPRHDEETAKHVHESPLVMLLPLAILAAGALLAGYLAKDYFIGEDYAGFWRKAIFTGPQNHVLEEAHHNTPPVISWLPTVMMVAGFALAWFSYIYAPSTPAWAIRHFKPIHSFLYNKWYIDELYDWVFVRPFKWLSRVLWKTGDGTIIDGLGPDGISARVIDITNRVVRLQSGFVYHYAFVMLIGITAIVSYFAYVYWAQFWKGF
jgi:NADH-quinone oxidoreductase subunit L